MAFVRALGAAVRARRTRLDLTRAQLAKRSGLSADAIADVEAGDPNLDLLQLVVIAAGLGIPLRVLLRRAERRIGWRGSGNGKASYGRASRGRARPDKRRRTRR